MAKRDITDLAIFRSNIDVVEGIFRRSDSPAPRR